MIWVTWRQHRIQALACLGLLAAIMIAAIALGIPMHSAYRHDGLPGCLARSGGADCKATITSFVTKFNGPARGILYAPMFLIPGATGAIVGAMLLGRELETGTWRLAWSQTVPRTRWLVTKLTLVTGGLVIFGTAITAVMSWYDAPLDRVSARLQAPLFNIEGVVFTCSLLCGFGLGVLAGLLLRNTIGAVVVAYIGWEIASVPIFLLNGPVKIPAAVVTRVPCQAGCPGAGTHATPPVTGHLGDLVLDVAHSGNQLIVTYLPASRFWPSQFLAGGFQLTVAVAGPASALWLLHRRTT